MKWDDGWDAEPGLASVKPLWLETLEIRVGTSKSFVKTLKTRDLARKYLKPFEQIASAINPRWPKC